MLKVAAATALMTGLLLATGARPHPAAPQADSRIAEIAAASPCARHRWPGRGRAPVGYIKGVALTYAKSFCESRAGGTAVDIMRRPLTRNGQDALVHYQSTLAAHGVNVDSVAERLRALYTLGIGLGMRESSGNTTEGRDLTARRPTANSAEAGLFQTSFDSFNVSPALSQLFDQYRANTGRCLLDTFKEGIPRVITRPVFGTGPGADYQRFTRECPAFATEYVMVMLRVNRRHFGPINRREAEYFQPCNDMLREVEAAASCAP
ncbi:MAG: hypothetical protein LC803_21635 [Acidobacteria bacterium]|nr:hypothetical protein [Acidobacteriota bacterium]